MSHRRTRDNAPERELPASVDAERSILGAILSDSCSYNQAAAANLSPEQFSLEDHRRIYRRMSELVEAGSPTDLTSMVEEFNRTGDLNTVGGRGYLSSLTEGVVLASLSHHIKAVKEKAQRRDLIHVGRAFATRAYEDPPSEIIASLQARLEQIARDTSGTARIQSRGDITDIFNADLSPVEYIVPELIPFGALVTIAGSPGVGKSFLAMRLAVSCAMGMDFLGRKCRRIPVLYIDRENPGALVKERVQRIGGGPVPDLSIWGNWLPDGPPELDDQRLLKMVKHEPLLLIADSLVRFKQEGEENSSDDMAAINAKLRRLADAGATVIALHHRGKGDKDYRGTEEIEAGVDMLYTLTTDGELLTLRIPRKNRYGVLLSLTIRPDFAAGKFELTESLAATERNDRITAIKELIEREPGLSQNKIVEAMGSNRNMLCKLLKDGSGCHWREESSGKGKPKRYYPLTYTAVPIQAGTGDTGI